MYIGVVSESAHALNHSKRKDITMMVWVAMVNDSSDIIGVYSSLALAACDVMKHATSYEGIYLDRLTSYSYYDISKTAYFYFTPIYEGTITIQPYRVEIQGVHLNDLLF